MRVFKVEYQREGKDKVFYADITVWDYEAERDTYLTIVTDKLEKRFKDVVNVEIVKEYFI